jgi:hypothetical protein
MNRNKRARLSVEPLEDRTALTYFGVSGGESIAIGDVVSYLPGPGPNDIVTGNGPGQVGLVSIRNASNQLLQEFYPFGTDYSGGVYVAVGEVTGDGNDAIVCGTGAGTTAVVKVFEFIDGGIQLISTFQPFGPNFTGGANVAAGNVTGPLVTSGNTGAADEVVVGMASGGSQVAVFGYNDSSGTPTYYELRSYQAFGTNYTGGVTLAVADISTQTGSTADDYASVITGMATTLPRIAIWNVQQPTVTLQAEYMAFNTANPANHHGINVAAGDTDGERGAQIFVNLRGTGEIRVFDGQTSAIITTLTATYPPQYGTMVNMAVGDMSGYAPTEDDEVTDTYYTRDLVVVTANITVNQIPVDLPGRKNSPAVLNGSHAL